MTRRGIIGLLASLPLAGCSLFLQRGSFRYRMTVFVKTSQGIVSGSSVMEIVASSRISAGTQSDARYSAGLANGEAVIVVVPDGFLFVLLRPRDDSNSLTGPIYEALNGGAELTNNDIMDFVKKMGAPGANFTADLPSESWPLMVIFRDINDPSTIDQADPLEVGVERITVSTTTDPVTHKIKNILKWLGPRGRPIIWPTRPTTSPTFAQTIYSEAFLLKFDK